MSRTMHVRHGENRLALAGSAAILASIAIAPPAQAAQPLGTQVVDALAVEQDLAAGDAARRLEQADDRRAGERLARTRLADHAEDLARRDRERDVLQRQQRAAARRELDAQVPDFEER